MEYLGYSFRSYIHYSNNYHLILTSDISSGCGVDSCEELPSPFSALASFGKQSGPVIKHSKSNSP